MPQPDLPLRPKVLVIDDEVGARESLRFALEREFTVWLAASVAEGLAVVDRETPEAIILDLRLPGEDGIEGLRRIRSRDPHVAVIVLTAYASLDTAIEALRLGADDYRTKPFDVPDLLSVVRRHAAVAREARRQEAGLAGDLQRVNDNLAARIVNDEQLAHLGRLAGALLHDLGGPLTTLELALERLRQAAAPASAASTVAPVLTRYVTDTRTTLQLMTEMIRAHQRLGQPQSETREPVPIDEVLNLALRVVKPAYTRKCCHIDRWTEWGGMLVLGDRLGLYRVFYNLLVNALEAVSPQAGRIEIACTRDDRHIVVTIRDNGPGLTPAELAQVFQPYFTTKPQGTGLGLNIARDIVREHGGELEVASTPGVGTTVAVRLPQAPVAKAEGPA